MVLENNILNGIVSCSLHGDVPCWIRTIPRCSVCKITQQTITLLPTVRLFTAHTPEEHPKRYKLVVTNALSLRCICRILLSQSHFNLSVCLHCYIQLPGKPSERRYVKYACDVTQSFMNIKPALACTAPHKR